MSCITFCKVRQGGSATNPDNYYYLDNNNYYELFVARALPQVVSLIVAAQNAHPSYHKFNLVHALLRVTSLVPPCALYWNLQENLS